jgi:hypothetical protein
MAVLGLSLEDAAAIGQVVAGCASVLALCGLVFVWKQVKLQYENSQVEVITGMTTLITQVDQVFVEHPQLWKYFNDRESPPSKGTTEGDKVRAIAMTMANVLDHVVEHLEKMKDETQDSWCRYIAEVWEKSPAFKEVLNDHETWWPGLQRQVRA